MKKTNNKQKFIFREVFGRLGTVRKVYGCEPPKYKWIEVSNMFTIDSQRTMWDDCIREGYVRDKSSEANSFSQALPDIVLRGC